MGHEGDNHISSFNMGLWQVHQQILLKWGVYTAFTYREYSVPDMRDGFLLWLVPGDVDSKDEIITWLEYELEPLRRQREVDWPGLHVGVETMLFKGIEPYLEREACEKMARQMQERLVRWLEERRQEGSDD